MRRVAVDRGHAVRERGFTLLEVLVAFIIAALAIGALLQGVGGGLQSTRVAAHYQEALSRARSRLAALGAAPPHAGEQAGDDGGGFTWRTQTIAAATSPRPLPGQAVKRAVLYTLTVTIGWTMDGRRRQVVLTTQRLAEAPPEPP